MISTFPSVVIDKGGNDSIQSKDSFEQMSLSTTTTSGDVTVHQQMVQMWNNLDKMQKVMWRDRAISLNKVPHIGSFETTPSAISDNGLINQEQVLWCLTLSWRRFVKIIR